MHPTLLLFLKLTAVVGIAILVAFIALFLLKIAVVAAIVAAILLGGFVLYNFFRRGSKVPTLR